MAVETENDLLQGDWFYSGQDVYLLSVIKIFKCIQML